MMCDMAEYYHILDMEALPVSQLAVLSFGLPRDSRVMRRVSGLPVTYDQLLLSSIVDHLALLVWLQTEDGVKGRNRPKSILSELLSTEETEKPKAYESGEAFLAAREAIIRRDVDGN